MAYDLMHSATQADFSRKRPVTIELKQVLLSWYKSKTYFFFVFINNGSIFNCVRAALWYTCICSTICSDKCIHTFGLIDSSKDHLYMRHVVIKSKYQTTRMIPARVLDDSLCSCSLYGDMVERLVLPSRNWNLTGLLLPLSRYPICSSVLHPSIQPAPPSFPIFRSLISRPFRWIVQN
jgi:hypothetical protein